MKKVFSCAVGIIFALCLMVTLLITSVEAVVYWLPGFFQKEYAKYNVTQTVDMTMEDLLYVTGEMMSYLRGEREDLHVMTTMGGESREFFNEREIAHMEDVRGLFLDALSIRWRCFLIMELCVVLAVFMKMDYRKTLPRAVLSGTGVFFLLTSLIAAIISTNFTKYFILFHHMFFTNDLWILDPATDMLINIVPEGFFKDTVVHIGVLFFLCVLALSLFCLAILKWGRKNPGKDSING